MTAYEASGFEFPATRPATTNEKGEYAIEGLPGGSYVVEFSAERGAGLNYVTQFYRNSRTSAGAERVLVQEHQATQHIDAELQVGGRIEGRVTRAPSQASLAGIEATAYEAGSEAPVGYATTNGNGEYTIAGLAAGSYEVEFSPEFESGLDYVTQYYRGASSLASATLVPVAEHESTPGIDAEMQIGAEITGAVTDAYTHLALAKAIVLVRSVGGALAAVAFTEANGQYTATGLASGSYVIEFLDQGHITQYYDNEPSFASANPVTLAQGTLIGGYSAALLPKAPANAVAPVASGTPAAASTLTCTSGTWTGSPTPTLAYSWLRDGVAIAGATANSYMVQAAADRADPGQAPQGSTHGAREEHADPRQGLLLARGGSERHHHPPPHLRGPSRARRGATPPSRGQADRVCGGRQHGAHRGRAQRAEPALAPAPAHPLGITARQRMRGSRNTSSMRALPLLDVKRTDMWATPPEILDARAAPVWSTGDGSQEAPADSVFTGTATAPTELS